MKSEEVAQYLKEHLQFFNEFPDLLADIEIPHPQDDKVVSLHERQVISLRDRNRVLQDKLRELISFGEENDVIGGKMHRLVIALLATTSMNEVLNALYFSLKEDFSVPLVEIRFWDVPCTDSSRIEFAPVSEDVHVIAQSLAQPYCGNHIVDEIKHWFGEGGEHLNSFAMIPLNTSQTIGLLVLGSPDAERFYPEMGTLHLKHLSELICTAITRYSAANQTNNSIPPTLDNLSNEQQT